MNYIGFDNKGNKLQIGDICRFKLDKVDMEGIISYDDTEFAYTFDINSEIYQRLVSIYMHRVDVGSIEKIINVYSTKNGDEFEFYRKLFIRN